MCVCVENGGGRSDKPVIESFQLTVQCLCSSLTDADIHVKGAAGGNHGDTEEQKRGGGGALSTFISETWDVMEVCVELSMSQHPSGEILSTQVLFP